MTSQFRFYRACLAGLLIGATAGCAGRPAMLPNADKSLRKTSAQFAADAAKRHPYPADAPRGGQAAGRAQVGYSLNQLEVVNLGDADWENAEIWVNKTYVVFVPKMERNKLKVLPFGMLFDDTGNSFPTDNKKVRIESVEVLMGGKMYDVTTKLAD
jgi:hypothetical protein